MRTNQPVLVFVGDDNRSSDFMDASGTYVLGAPTLRIALAQVAFSQPDAIIIDASPENMEVADKVFDYLRKIDHPVVIMLSDTPEHWDTAKVNDVTIVPNNISNEALSNHLLGLFAGAMKAVS